MDEQKPHCGSTAEQGLKFKVWTHSWSSSATRAFLDRPPLLFEPHLQLLLHLHSAPQTVPVLMAHTVPHLSPWAGFCLLECPCLPSFQGLPFILCPCVCHSLELPHLCASAPRFTPPPQGSPYCRSKETGHCLDCELPAGRPWVLFFSLFPGRTGCLVNVLDKQVNVTVLATHPVSLL